MDIILSMETLKLTHESPFQGLQGSYRPRRGRLARSQRIAATQRQETVTSLPLPDGNLGLPLIGETLQLLSQGDTFGAERSAKHGKMWKTNILGSPTVMIFGEEDCRRLLKEEGRLVEVIWPDVTAELVGTASLNLLKGDEHLRLKRLLGDAFSEEAAEALKPTLQECTKLFCKRWAQKGTFSAYDECKLWAWTVFGAGVLGLPGTVETGERLCALMDSLQGGFQTAPVKLPLTPYQKAVSARESVVQIVQDQIYTNSEKTGLRKCCLAKMLGQKQLTDAQVIDNIIAAAFGNASAGPTAAKAFQHLAAGRARDDVVEELRGVSDLASHDLQQLKSTNAVVKEMLRITPIVPALFRRALIDFELSGRLIPKGWSVYIHTGASVQKYNQDSFQPHRWLEQDTAHSNSSSAAKGEQSPSGDSRSQDAQASSAGRTDGIASDVAGAGAGCPEHSLPFGLGPRMCLGRHVVKAALALLVAELVSRHEWQMGDPAEQWSVFPTVRPKGGLQVQNFTKL